MKLSKVSKAIIVMWLSALTAANAITFNLTAAEGMTTKAIQGFQDAADIWSSYILDDFTMNISINFTELATGVLGSSASTKKYYNYWAHRDYLTADATSAADAIATAHLEQSNYVDLYINRTVDSPNGTSSLTPYLDNNDGNNNSVIRMTSANAKALGLLSATDTAEDASITFSNQFLWDYDISTFGAGRYDFVGAAVHEIGHALGFISGIDVLDGYDYVEDSYTRVSPLDLYRYSDESYAEGVIDWTADEREKYFSIDGGDTELTTFSTGVNYGDGQQASHWEDNLDIGIMDPTAAIQEVKEITALDLLALDVIGYEVIPEPSILAMLALSGTGLLIGRRFFCA
jgi:hypothetical protein